MVFYSLVRGCFQNYPVLVRFLGRGEQGAAKKNKKPQNADFQVGKQHKTAKNPPYKSKKKV